MGSSSFMVSAMRAYMVLGSATREPVKTRILSQPRMTAASTAFSTSSLRRSQRLSSLATRFAFTPLTAGAQNLQARDLSSTLSAATSVYYTPNPATVWWNRPVKLQLLAQGQSAGPGIAPYDANPTTGGRMVSGTSPLTAGVTTTITVNVVDQYFNVVKGTTPFLDPVTLPVSSFTPVVELRFPSDVNIQGRNLEPAPYQKSLVAGATTFTVIPVTRSNGFAPVFGRNQKSQGATDGTRIKHGFYACCSESVFQPWLELPVIFSCQNSPLPSQTSGLANTAMDHSEHVIYVLILRRFARRALALAGRAPWLAFLIRRWGLAMVRLP